jgi:isoleucyl-tRNA synthetase
MAPVTPFLAEELYQNLVRSVDPEPAVSVHLTGYPRPNPNVRDEKLLREVALIREIVELGRAARNKAGIKVRQPLAELLVKLPNPSDRDVVLALAEQIRDELNVKQVRLVDELSDLVTYAVKGKPNLIGPKFGREAPRVLAALRSADPALVAAAVRAGRDATLDGFTLTPDEIELSVENRSGLSVATRSNLAVGITTGITPELAEEGLAREIVHRIQGLRKTADFNLDDRIVTYYAAPEAVAHVVQRFAPYIKGETLSRELVAGSAPAGAAAENLTLNGLPVTLAVAR